jgi:hypothetical protein
MGGIARDSAFGENIISVLEYVKCATATILEHWLCTDQSSEHECQGGMKSKTR